MSRFSRLAAAALALAVVACSDNKITAPNNQQQTTTAIGTGKGFTLLLTDAPGDFKAAVVTISKITLQGTGGSVTLLDQPVTVDLLQLQNQVASIVKGLDVPAGSYSQLRLVLSGAYIEVENSHGTEIYATSPTYAGLPPGAHATGDLMMPSMEQSGLKIDLPGGKLDVGSDETIVMIDFDAKNSFGHQAGNSGKWIMHPVIKATNVTFGGNVLAQLQLGSGVTLPIMGNDTIRLTSFKAVLTGGGVADTLPVTLVNGVYQVLFKGLAPGQYTLTFLSPTGLITAFSPTLPVTVTVAQKMTTTQVVTLTSAAAPGAIVAVLGLAQGVTLPSIGSPPTAVTLGQFKAVLTPPSGPADTTAFTSDNGTFKATFANRVPGTYSLNVLSPAGTTITYTPTLPLSISLASGATVTDTVKIASAK